MDNEKKYKTPERKAGDAGYAVVKAGLSSLPIVGAAASELLGLIVSPPLEKRKSEWMEMVGNGLRDLEKKMGIVLEDLQNNDRFIDSAMDATQIALRTSQKEKLGALRNALLNSVIPNSAEESLQKMFFSFIDIFTIYHMKLLELFQNPRNWFEKHGIKYPEFYISSSLSQLIENAFPGLKRELYDPIWKDLFLRGLVSTEGLQVMMTDSGADAKRTTPLGDAFIKFISNPLES
jgi:hypothetical protein